MAEFTPGPWRTAPDPATGDWIVSEAQQDDDGLPVVVAQATLHTDSKGRVYIDHDELLANANLIAAAPDLLEAVSEAAGMMVFLRSALEAGQILSDDDRIRYQEVRTNLAAALAKAQGQP